MYCNLRKESVFCVMDLQTCDVCVRFLYTFYEGVMSVALCNDVHIVQTTAVRTLYSNKMYKLKYMFLFLVVVFLFLKVSLLEQKYTRGLGSKFCQPILGVDGLGVTISP